MVSPGTEVPSVPEGGSWAQQVACEGRGGTGTRRESALLGQLWFWVLAVVGASPDPGAPWGPGRSVDILGARGPLLRWRLLAVRFRVLRQKQLRLRVIQNDFRAPHISWRPPHLHCWFYASSMSMPRGPTWQHFIGASSVLSSDPWGCALVRFASLACLPQSPLPFASFCLLMLSRAGPGRAPEPPARHPLRCPRPSVRRSPACCC